MLAGPPLARVLAAVSDQAALGLFSGYGALCGPRHRARDTLDEGRPTDGERGAGAFARSPSIGFLSSDSQGIMTMLPIFGVRSAPAATSSRGGG